MDISTIAEYLRQQVLMSEKYIDKNPEISNHFLIAATLDKRGRVIAIGENSIKTHPIMKHYGGRLRLKHKIHLHAEMSALVRSQRKVHGIIVIRVSRNQGNLTMAKPCPICQAAIDDAGIKNIYYSDRDGDIVSLIRLKEDI